MAVHCVLHAQSRLRNKHIYRQTDEVLENSSVQFRMNR